MNFKSTIIAIAAATAVIAPLATATDAEAKRGGKSTYYETFNTRHAERGYEGFVGGRHNSYCSYRREPRRRCYISRSGYERCKIVGWRLIQHCY
ncbi:MAG: hypothetical protein AAF709_06660 [Pseudomonadota bacterium]